MQLAGAAVHDAAGKLLEVARQRAADLLEAAPDDIVLDRDEGRFHVAGTPTIGLGWDELGVEGADPLGGLSPTWPTPRPPSRSAPTSPWSRSTPRPVEADLIRIVAVDDAGRILNPLLAEGQVHGGLAQGVAQALLEEVRFDDDGNPLTSNFADYAVISATEVPMFERVADGDATPLNELGAKGIGESGTIGSTPAVHNAVIDALAHLGVRHIDMPVTPEKVWRALSS